ncbi:MAG: diacylglycerol kinase family lipid kinase [Myxococcota bacterium]
MNYKHIAAIVNFHSAGGSTRKEWDKIKAALEEGLGREIRVFSTDESGSAIKPAQNAISESADLIISIGGDGTHNEVANGILTAPEANLAVMAIIPRGTGSDLRKTLKIPLELDKAVALIASGKKSDIDVGKTSFLTADGDHKERYFLNILSAGLGGYVDAEVNSRSKWMGGKLSFMLGTVRALYKYKNVFLRVSYDDAPFEEIVANNFVIANGQYFGGGMWVAPNAKVTDGLFDVIVFGDIPKRDVILKGNSIYKGKHLGLPGVTERRAKRVVIETNDDALIDLDGEQPGRAPLTAEILPAKLPLICGL